MMKCLVVRRDWRTGISALPQGTEVKIAAYCKVKEAWASGLGVWWFGGRSGLAVGLGIRRPQTFGSLACRSGFAA